MQLAKLALAATASLSVLTGAMFQGASQAKSLPIALFSQAKASDFLGEAKCVECHDETVAKFPKSGHATYMHAAGLAIDKQGCEACHGPGALHIKEEGGQVISYSKITPKEVSDACLRCHGDVMKKSHWRTEAHARANVSCVGCHQIHPKGDTPNVVAGDKNLVKKQVFAAVKPSNALLKADEPTLCNECHKTEVSQFRQNSHHPVSEGRMICSDCHSVHPTKADRVKVSTTKEKCVSCHGEIAGPFAYEHDPVAGWTGGGCAECHRSHGSHNPTLLKSFSRGLCGQCHTDKQTTHHPGQSCWNAGCHVAIHGSNSSRLFLTR
jgi:predicted CXXCH cytochrome family protein